MLIISYDKNKSIKVGENWYCDFCSLEGVLTCRQALIKEFSDSINTMNTFFIDGKWKFSSQGPLRYIHYTNNDNDKNNLFSLPSDDIMGSLYQIIKPYDDIIRLNQPQLDNCEKLNECDNKTKLNHFVNRLPSVYDIKNQFPPSSPDYTYDKYGFPVIKWYAIYAHAQVHSTTYKLLAGLYTNKNKFDLVNQKIIDTLKKGDKIIDLSDL